MKQLTRSTAHTADRNIKEKITYDEVYYTWLVGLVVVCYNENLSVKGNMAASENDIDKYYWFYLTQPPIYCHDVLFYLSLPSSPLFVFINLRNQTI